MIGFTTDLRLYSDMIIAIHPVDLLPSNFRTVP